MTDIVTRLDKGSALSYVEMDANLTELARRTGSGWNDLVQEVNVRSGTNAPTLGGFRDGLYAYAFDAGVNQECFANFHLGHDYIAGTMVYPHVHWSANTTSTGVVRWGIEYTVARRNDSVGVRQFGQTSTIYIDVPVTQSHQYWHMVSEFADGQGISGDILEEDTLIMCRFFRDAEHVNDTFPDPVFLLTVDIHYQCDTLSTPLRFPPFV